MSGIYDEINSTIIDTKKSTGIDLEVKDKRLLLLNKVLNHLSKLYKFQFNTEQTELQFKHINESKYSPLEDYHLTGIYNELMFHPSKLEIPFEKLRHIIHHDAICQKIAPLRDYFLNLPKWDGQTDHIRIMLRQIYLKNEEERAVFVDTFKKWFVALVACFLDEVDINQQCFVLIGEQTGQLKTTWLNSLVPEHLRMDYLFTGVFNFEDVDDKKKLAQKLLINIDEMAALTRTDEKVLKTVLTSSKFEGRLKYGRFDTKRKRIASFCGSTNDRTFLTDETGNRRYLVFEVEKIDMNGFDMAMAYSQALALYKAKFKFWFDSQDIKTINSRNEDFRRVSHEEELIMTYLRVPTPEQLKQALVNDVTFMTTSQINKYISNDIRININELTKKRIAEILRRLGFECKSRRIKGYDYPIKCYAVIKVKDMEFTDNLEYEGIPGVEDAF